MKFKIPSPFHHERSDKEEVNFGKLWKHLTINDKVREKNCVPFIPLFFLFSSHCYWLFQFPNLKGSTQDTDEFDL